MDRTYDLKSDDAAALNDEKLDMVAGGLVNDGGCIRLPTLLPSPAPTPWTFKDVFAKHTIG